jgi:hypothetical protein
MVMAKIDRKPFPIPLPKPLPKPPEGTHTDCFPIPTKPPVLDIDKLKDGIEFSGKDKDGNNNLNRDEFDAGRHPKEAILDPKKFDRYDRDNDGYVNREEYHAGKEGERFNQVLRGKLDLPKWEGKKELKDLGQDVVKEVGQELKDAGNAVKDAVKDIF